MTTRAARPLKPWNVRAFLIGLGASVVLAWLPHSVTHDTIGIVVYSILGVVAAIGLAPLPSRSRSALQVLFAAACFCVGVFASSEFACIQTRQLPESSGMTRFLAFVLTASPIALTLGALLFARVFVWCQRPRRVV